MKKKIEIFSGTQCSYCNQAKALLDEKGVDYMELDISNQQHRNELVRRLPRSRSIPQIFVDGVHIGGFEDLLILNENDRFGEVLL